jgi:hypothetical protein
MRSMSSLLRETYMLKSSAKTLLISICLFSSVSAFAWVCTATNARRNGTWVGRAAYIPQARQYAINFCIQANRTLSPGSCHIVSCSH